MHTKMQRKAISSRLNMRCGCHIMVYFPMRMHFPVFLVSINLVLFVWSLPWSNKLLRKVQSYSKFHAANVILEFIGWALQTPLTSSCPIYLQTSLQVIAGVVFLGCKFHPDIPPPDLRASNGCHHHIRSSFILTVHFIFPNPAHILQAHVSSSYHFQT